MIAEHATNVSRPVLPRARRRKCVPSVVIIHIRRLFGKLRWRKTINPVETHTHTHTHRVCDRPTSLMKTQQRAVHLRATTSPGVTRPRTHAPSPQALYRRRRTARKTERKRDPQTQVLPTLSANRMPLQSNGRKNRHGPVKQKQTHGASVSSVTLEAF